MLVPLVLWLATALVRREAKPVAEPVDSSVRRQPVGPAGEEEDEEAVNLMQLNSNLGKSAPPLFVIASQLLPGGSPDSAIKAQCSEDKFCSSTSASPQWWLGGFVVAGMLALVALDQVCEVCLCRLWARPERARGRVESDPSESEWSFTDLHAAARAGSAEGVRRHPGGLDARDAWDQTPLHVAAKHGHVECVEALLALGSDLNAVDFDDRTPLALAALAGHRPAVKALLKAGDGSASLGRCMAESEMPKMLKEELFSRIFRQKGDPRDQFSR